jgi:hypothetical protein
LIILNENDCILFDAVDVLDARSNAATSVETRRFIIFAKRPAFQAKLCEIIGEKLQEIADVPGLKEGSAKIVPGINKITVIGSARLEPDGPFKLCSFDFDVAGVYPLDLISAARLRSICRLVFKPNLTNLSTMLEPYCR